MRFQLSLAFVLLPLTRTQDDDMGGMGDGEMPDMDSMMGGDGKGKGGGGGMPDMASMMGGMGGGAGGMDMASMMGGMGGGGGGGMGDMASMMGGMGGGMGGMGGAGGGGPPEDPFPPVTSDVKFIACSTCKKFAGRLHSEMQKWNKTVTGKEEGIQSEVASLCDTKSAAGAWLTEFDMVESSDGTALELKRQSSQGECEVECKTIELACKQMLQEAEIDLVVGLFKSFKANKPLDKKDLAARLCTADDAWSSNMDGTCTSKIAKVPKKRKAGPVWRAKGSPPAAPVVDEADAPKKKKGKGAKKSAEL